MIVEIVVVVMQLILVVVVIFLPHLITVQIQMVMV
jgi:hypothetical protein